MIAILKGVAVRFAVVYAFQATWWVVGQGMKVSKKLRQKAETVDYDKVQEYLKRQQEV